MITVTTRPYSDSEKKTLISQIPSLCKRIENPAMIFVFSLIVLLAPFLLLDKYFHFSSYFEAVSLVPILVVAVIVTRKISKYAGGVSNSEALESISNGQVEVSRVASTRAIERADPEDFGVAYYLEVTDKGESKVLYLQGQYLDELGEGVFPATEFEVVRDLETREIIDLKIFGAPFKSERILPAFDMQTWRDGKTPNDGDILYETLDELT